ncbi:Aminoglycoside phosphotransferase, partial [Penicillium daleae]
KYPTQRPVSGSFNWAIFISFEDGVRWVFRSPHSRSFMPMEIGEKILTSEAATLRYLRAHSDIPVPEVYDYRASDDNKIGISFILMSEAHGWPPSKIWRPAGSPQPDLDAPSKAKVLSQLGAPVPSRSDYSSRMQYESAVDQWNDFVTIGRKIDSAENRLDYMIAGDILRDIVRNFNLAVIKPGTFPLCHPDLSVNNIFVDDDYNISCIIDWAFSSSIPESMLLAPPGLPQYCDELTSDFQMPFINGFIAAMPQSMERSVCNGEVSLQRRDSHPRFMEIHVFIFDLGMLGTTEPPTQSRAM